MSNKLPSRLLAIGSVAYDSIATPFGKKAKTLGGSATYFSLASSLFSPTSIIGAVGKDFKEFQIYKNHKIDISGVEVKRGKTFHWSGKYHFDLNTRDTLKTELGVFADFKPTLARHHCEATYVFLGNIQPKLQLEVLKQQSSAGRQTKLVGLDTMNLWIETAKKDLLKVLTQIDLLFINDSEARQLSKQHNLLKAARVILKMMRGQASPQGRGGKILIIKQGEHGLLMFDNNSVFNLPGYPLEDVTDPTGAGDSFAGAFMGYVAKTGDLSPTNLKKACAIASVVASFTVEGFGTSNLEKISLSDVNKRLLLYKKFINF
jgi:sugar/nucleoside kinase (ribokinase family)